MKQEPSQESGQATLTGVESARAGDQLAEWGIAVESIGTSGARIVKALRTLVSVPEAQLARLLFQAPSVLVRDLPREVAEQAQEILLESGLETRVLAPGESVEGGDDSHEIALVIRDVSRMTEVLAEVVRLLGVSLSQARTMLCSAPAVLVGKVSANTVEAFRSRFEPLGVELDVTRPKEAVYDVFLGHCAPVERARVRAVLSDIGFDLPDDPEQLVVQMGLTLEQAERIWERFARSSLPLRIISRDFERFDVTLDEASDTPGMIEFLVASTGMPETVARGVVKQTPVVLHQIVDFDQMTECISKVDELGGEATGHLTVFQKFELRVVRCGDEKRSAELLEMLADYGAGSAATALKEGVINDPLAHLKARWLQYELQQAGTETERILR